MQGVSRMDRERAAFRSGVASLGNARPTFCGRHAFGCGLTVLATVEFRALIKECRVRAGTQLSTKATHQTSLNINDQC